MTAPVSILIVDDEVRNLDVLESILYSSEYRLQRATSADDALLALVHGDFAVLVLDINMPGMTGIELANLIKQRKRTQHIPILFLTAYYQDEKNVLEGYGVGAVDYLTKPVNPDILRSKVGVFADLHRKTQALATINRTLELEISQRQQAEEALRQANNELESRVKARTADLTKANDALRDSQERLSASEAHLLLVADHASVYLAHIDRDYRFRFVNRSYADRYGVDRDKIIGTHIVETVGQAAYEVVRPQMEEAFAGVRVEFEMEIPYETLGSRWVHVVYQPERGLGGGVTGLVAAVTDVTERRQAEQEVERARDEAVAASRAKDDFLAALSHELRTPLNPVLLLASEAVANPMLAPEVRSDFDVILKNTTLEARLIDDLLDLTRITHGKLTLEREPVDVHRLLNDALATVRPEVEERRIAALTVELSASAHYIVGDSVRLQQIFWNVLKNAIKFTGSGGKVRVETATTPGAGEICITISDTGIGMTAAELELAFKPFAQGEHTTRADLPKFGGLGLGLAIARSLVEMHRGRIRGESPGRGLGTSFYIEFPLASPEELAAFPAAPAPASASFRRAPLADDEAETPVSALNGTGPHEGEPPRRRVLVVDDHAPTLAILKTLLNRRQFDVLPATSLAEARSLVDAQHIDLFISDIGLPDGSGCTLMTELRAARPDLAGIALSGYGMEEDVERSRDAGFAEHLTKPVNIAALDRAISRLIG